MSGVPLVEVYPIDEIITTDDADDDELENGSPLNGENAGAVGTESTPTL
jgi:hypothetical protein